MGSRTQTANTDSQIDLLLMRYLEMIEAQATKAKLDSSTKPPISTRRNYRSITFSEIKKGQRVQNHVQWEESVCLQTFIS
jgi:hypothetical protein